MTSQPEAPLQRVTVTKKGQVLFIVICPHCRREHMHGGGDDLTRARRLLSHRVAHCAPSEGYVLVDPEGLL